MDDVSSEEEVRAMEKSLEELTERHNELVSENKTLDQGKLRGAGRLGGHCANGIMQYWPRREASQQQMKQRNYWKKPKQRYTLLMWR